MKIEFGLQEGSHQAQSNLKFLMMLKDPCVELSDAHPRDIPPMLPKILNLIRMIWVNSEFYKTRERLTGILRKVTFFITFYSSGQRFAHLHFRAFFLFI